MCVIWSVKLKLLLIMTTRNCVQANNKHDLILLHSDKDFEHIAEIISALKLYNA